MPIPPLINLAEYLLDVCNIDFDNTTTDLNGDESQIGRLNLLMEAWLSKGSATEGASTPCADSKGDEYFWGSAKCALADMRFVAEDLVEEL